MNLQAKVTLFLSILVAATMVILVAISAYSFRSFSIASATEHLRTTAEVVRVSLTESMINGVIERRESFLTRLMEVKGLKSARVARGPQVQQQFGKGLSREAPADEIEMRVLREGVPEYVLLTEGGEAVFRGTIPFVATSTGSPNCLNCHKVAEGAVLGVVTMTMSIEHMKSKALYTIAGMVGAMSLFAALLVLLMRRLVRPISETAAGVEAAVQCALAGDFTAKVAEKTHDEIGQIAADTNKLLAFLNSGLNRIGEQVTQLTNRKPHPGENQLTATIAMVEGLTRAARFKQAIEEDESKAEIYGRLAKILAEEFGIRESSLYEVTPNRKQMAPILVDGEAGGDCRWCDPEILVRPEACRVRRTGHIVDSTLSPGICTAFRPPADCADRQHICFPIIQSGAVGSVLQLVVTPERREVTQEQLPYIGVYLRETSPVLEAKRLMDSLRESTLRDPMTGLNNRRFLEEFVATLIANVQRRKTTVSILMLDLDFFKMVNDTHGHDAGDTVLKALAKTLQQAVRASDLVIRYGGEEFLILLLDAKEGCGDKIAETIRARVEDLKIPIGTATLQKTISIGIADYPTDSDTFWQAVKFADVALYRAKETGRNRVVRFTPDLWTSSAEHY